MTLPDFSSEGRVNSSGGEAQRHGHSNLLRAESSPTECSETVAIMSRLTSAFAEVDVRPGYLPYRDGLASDQSGLLDVVVVVEGHVQGSPMC
jgi:hypothetical protein